MERQKIFWVVLAVSVFVVVVLVVGVFLLRQRPSATGAPATVSTLSDSGTQIYEYQRDAPVPQPGAGQAGSAQKPGDTQTMHFYIGEGGEATAAGQGTRAAPTTPPAAAQKAQEKAVTPPAQAGTRAAAAPQKTAAVTPPAQPRKTQRSLDYWIQTGSYKSQGKAEELATLIEGKGLNGRVFSYAAKGGVYFRVRIGPYGNKGEAEKFLSIVKQIQGLESSYISQAKAARNIN
jgi:cell division septation protein DedD